VDGVYRAYQRGGVETYLRDSGEFGRLVFSGLDLVPPGVVVMPEWRPDEEFGVRPLPSEIGINAGVARKP
jgi:hypothetical protein